MPSGDTYVSSLADSQELIIDSARIRREYTVVMPGLAERHDLPDNTGLSWEEVELNRMTAQTVTDTTILDNAQEFADTVRAYTPTPPRVRYRIHLTVADAGSLRFADAEHLRATDGAHTLGRRAAVLQGDLSGVLNLPRRSALHAVRLGHSPLLIPS